MFAIYATASFDPTRTLRARRNCIIPNRELQPSQQLGREKLPMARPQALYLFAVAVASALAGIASWTIGDGAGLAWWCAAAVLSIGGLGLVIWAVRRHRAATEGRSNRSIPVTLFVLMVSPLVFVATQWAVDRSLGWTDLLIHRSSYMRIVQAAGKGAPKPPIGASVEAGADAYDRSMWRTASDGTRFAFDLGGSGRVAFPFPTRSRETRDGILYDPSGIEEHRLLASAGALAEDHISFVPDDTWTVLSCTHMVGRFYRCRFAPS